ncbi:hypothetical protein [Leifsonia sp. TF02-11]|nr:hypothetical protein [Leifsonia sp. TF02-11]
MRRDYDINRRPPLAPIVGAIIGLVLAAVAVACVVLYIAGMPLR